MQTMLVLYADEGKVLTDGTTYGKQIFLAEGNDGSSYYEITETEYKEILANEEANNQIFDDEHNHDTI